MNDKIVLTPYFEDFIAYYFKAKILQEECNLGGKNYVSTVGDDLMEQVTIYDTVERQHAGFQNMLQDLWHGSRAPKYYKQDEQKQMETRSYNLQHALWSRTEWLFVFMLHRITGSGASFEADHGYRNTILPKIAKMKTIGEMVEFLRNYETPMFTSIGNQIPMFPKPAGEYKKGSKLFLCEHMESLTKDTWRFISKINLDRKATIREIVDFMCEWNRERGMKRFHFQYTATAADLADYYPEFVEADSHMYYGKNAKESMDMMANKIGRYKKDLFYDYVMEEATRRTEGAPRDLEDVMCDYIRYIENYIPSSKQKTYDHLDRTKIWNTSAIKDHPKGRQQWMLNTDKWEW